MDTENYDGRGLSGDQCALRRKSGMNIGYFTD